MERGPGMKGLVSPACLDGNMTTSSANVDGGGGARSLLLAPRETAPWQVNTSAGSASFGHAYLAIYSLEPASALARQ